MQEFGDKMELLKLNRKMLKFLAMCPLADGSGVHLRIGQIAVVVVVLFYLIYFSFTSLIFFRENFPPFEQCNLAVGQMLGLVQVAISYTSLVLQARKVEKFLDQIQTVFDQCESAKLSSPYLRVSNFSEKFIKWMLLGSNGIFIVAFILAAMATALFYHIRDGHVVMEKLFLPWQMNLYMDTSTVVGYTCTLLLELTISLVYLTVVVTYATLFLTMGLTMGAFQSHYRLLLEEINELIETNKPDSDVTIELKRRLSKAIQLHYQAQEVFELCRDTLGETILAQVALAALVIAGMQTGMEGAIKSFNLLAFTSLVATTSDIGNIFLFCFVGSFVTENFSLYADTTYNEFHWYKLPIELQPYATLIIANAQQPCSFSALGIFDLNLALFTRIMKTTWTYILMFRS